MKKPTNREIATPKAREAFKWQIIISVHRLLDDLAAEVFKPQRTSEEVKAWFDGLGPEIHAAERGDLGPLLKSDLLKKYPGLMPLLVALPKRKQTKEEPGPVTQLDVALWAMERIPKLWKGDDLKRDARLIKLKASEIAAWWVLRHDETDETELQDLIAKIEKVHHHRHRKKY